MQMPQTFRAVAGAGAAATLSALIFAWSGNSTFPREAAPDTLPRQTPLGDSATDTPPSVQEPSAYRCLSGFTSKPGAAQEQLLAAAPGRAVDRVRVDWGRVSSSDESPAASETAPAAFTFKAPIPVFLAAAPATVPATAAKTPGEAAATRMQQTELDRMEQDFTKAVGGTGQDPQDPGYLQRWTDARELSDEEFRGKFGWEAFLQRQLAAEQNAID